MPINCCLSELQRDIKRLQTRLDRLLHKPRKHRCKKLDDDLPIVDDWLTQFLLCKTIIPNLVNLHKGQLPRLHLPKNYKLEKLDEQNNWVTAKNNDIIYLKTVYSWSGRKNIRQVIYRATRWSLIYQVFLRRSGGHYTMGFVRFKPVESKKRICYACGKNIKGFHGIDQHNGEKYYKCGDCK